MSSFDALAATWEDARRRARARIISEKIATSLVGCTGGRAMEFGCGTGLIGLSLASCFRELILLDQSPGMIREARARIRALELSHARAVCHDLAEAPWPEAKPFDILFSSMALHHVTELPPLLSRFHDMLRPGGLVCLVDLAPVSPAFHASEPDFAGHHGFAPAAFARMLEEAGFRGVKADVFYQEEKPLEGGMVEYELFCGVGEAGFAPMK